MPNKLTNNEFLLKSNKIHNNKYCYEEVNYVNNKTKVKIICPYHGMFEQSPSVHLRTTGCKKCIIGYSVKKTIDSFIKEANIIHNNEYDYSNFQYLHTDSPSIIVCKYHGNFLQSAHSHLMGRGCQLCGRIKCGQKQLITTNNFIEQANIIHNNKYLYDRTWLAGMKNNVIITCRLHGDFQQRPDNHLKQIGCPKCSRIVSKPEMAWLEMLNISDENRHKTIKIGNLRFSADAYVPETNTIYEFYGDFWHGNPIKYKSEDINIVNKKTFGELYLKTIEREKILINSGYKIVSIWENDFNILVA